MASQPSSKETISKQINGPCVQRRGILNEIEKLESAGVDPSKSGRIDSLNDQHNSLLDQEEVLETQTLLDPLQILPPELWPALLPRYPPSDLLVLTQVSTRWRDGILSIPLLWCDIHLDSTQGDYLSHAVSSLTLSPSELTIHLPYIVAESSRITFLSISSLGYG